MSENNTENKDLVNVVKSFRVPEKDEANSGFIRTLVVVFFTVLVSGIIFVSVVLKGASNVDLEIGDNPVASMNQRGEEVYEDNIRMQIDQRLKMIQNEEEMPGVSESSNYETTDDLIKKLRADNSSANMEQVSDEKVKENENIQVQQTVEDDSLEPVKLIPQPAPTQNFISKVYIGQFADMQKAVDLQSSIVSAGLDVMPIVKEVNGYYTVQAGAFTSYDSAKNLADKLYAAGYSAKVVRELR